MEEIKVEDVKVEEASRKSHYSNHSIFITLLFSFSITLRVNSYTAIDNTISIKTKNIENISTVFAVNALK